ncbi:unnamed protein product [Blepharisma stoltei]|uniref:Palmitoyltransferase n=1 Tax=Blepharisma stoltei TaxID=1481888 RepID=A0AAU9J9J7_9CILI|nr:unnamed protein product [Blepharisma stoltei]
MKKNGFQRPFHTLQIIAWALIGSITVLFYVFVIPVFPNELQIMIGIIFSAFFLLTLILGFLCTFIDPTDPAIHEELIAKKEMKDFDLKKYPKICQMCKAHVHADSKHCRECERCVDHFDHHCKWLNNCIGRRNYKLFVKLIWSLEVLVSIITICGSAAFNEILNGQAFKERLEENLNITGDGIYCYLVAVCFMVVVSGLVAIANAQLIGFHTWLMLKKLTTYEYILSKRKAKKYEVVEVTVNNSKVVMEEIPLEEIFEPYIDNPEYAESKPIRNIRNSSGTVVPVNWNELQKFTNSNFTLQNPADNENEVEKEMKVAKEENAQEDPSMENENSCRLGIEEKSKENLNDTTAIENSGISA